MFGAAMILYPIWVAIATLLCYAAIRKGNASSIFYKKHGSLFYEIEPGQGLNTYMYYVYFLVRRLVYVLTLVYLYNYPEL